MQKPEAPLALVRRSRRELRRRVAQRPYGALGGPLFPGIPGDLDAVVPRYTDMRSVYIFKGSKYMYLLHTMRLRTPAGWLQLCNSAPEMTGIYSTIRFECAARCARMPQGLTD